MNMIKWQGITTLRCVAKIYALCFLLLLTSPISVFFRSPDILDYTDRVAGKMTEMKAFGSLFFHCLNVEQILE